MGKPQPPPIDMANLLGAVPVANRAVRERRNGDTLILYVPLRQRWWMGPPFCWMPGVNFRKEKGVALDRLGQEVWKGINGRRSVEQLVERFAEKHKVRFHEARISVMTFLRMLMQRELIAVVGPKGQGAEASTGPVQQPPPPGDAAPRSLDPLESL